MGIGGRLNALYDLLAALSLANLCFLAIWRELLFANAEDSYWIPDYTSETFFAAVINVMVLAFLIFGIIRLLFHSQRSLVAAVSRLFVLSLLLFPANYFRTVLGVDEHTVHWFQDHWWITLPSSVLIGTSIILAAAIRLNQVTRSVGLICLIFSPFALANLLQAGWIAIEEPSTGTASRTREMAFESGEKQRVVWLLMDELDLRLAFLERPPGLSLPELDRLRAQSLFARDAISYSRNTEEAIPSFLLQKVVKSARPVGPQDLHLTFMEFEELDDARFSSMPNVFAAATAHGSNIAILGFYHPYCRLFDDVAAYCRNYAVNTYAPYATHDVFAEMWSQFLGITPFYRRINAIKIYSDTTEQIKRTVGDTRFDLVYIHASVPHGPNIWDSRSRRFTIMNTSKDGYFDNLVLADRLLGTIRLHMEQAGLWDSTVVLLTSDHEWRHVYLYDHQRVRKIPFLLKMRGQRLPIDIRSRFAPMRVTKDLLMEIQTGSLESSSEVASWLESRVYEPGTMPFEFNEVRP